MKEKYVLVTGAAGGIGKETTVLLADKGYNVFACDIDEIGLNSFDDKNIIPIRMDVSDIGSIDEASTLVKSYTSYLNGLINIAGVFDQFPLVEATYSSYKKLMDVNLMGPQSLIGMFFPLLHQVKGRVINLSSETVLAQMPLQSYGFSKKLFDVWNTQLRIELKLLDMEVVVVRSGGHQTPFITKSSEVLGRINKESRYASLMKKIKHQGQKMLDKKQADPIDLAVVFHKALTASKPRKVYYVNVSILFKSLSIIPSGLLEFLMVRRLKKWI